ncbi:hypothetical protein ACSBR2_026761 [Camellia fascicularis]
MLALTVLITLWWSSLGKSMPIYTTVAQDGSGNFTRIADAILAAPNYSKRRYYIKIKAGFYRENIFVGEQKTNLTFVGDGMNKKVISGNKSYGGGFKTYDTATAGIEGQGFVAQDITFENTAGPYKNQAVALRNQAENSAFFKCRFQGYQDTLYTVRGKQFFRECEIYGTVDFIFGNAAVFFQNSIIYAKKPLNLQTNTITAQKREKQDEKTGTIMQNCTIKAADDLRQQNFKFKTFLGRPWGNFSRTIIMKSYLDDIIDPKGWLEWNGRSPDRVYYAVYKNTGPRANTGGRVPWEKVINSSIEATNFTLRNFIEGDKWIPATGIPFFLDLL